MLYSGFVIETPFDAVPLALSLDDGDPLLKIKALFLTKLQSVMQQHFGTISFTQPTSGSFLVTRNGPTLPVLIFMRIKMMSKDETVDYMKQERAQSGSTSTEIENTIDISPAAQPISISNELRVAQQLATICEEVLIRLDVCQFGEIDSKEDVNYTGGHGNQDTHNYHQYLALEVRRVEQAIWSSVLEMARNTESLLVDQERQSGSEVSALSVGYFSMA